MDIMLVGVGLSVLVLLVGFVNLIIKEMHVNRVRIIMHDRAGIESSIKTNKSVLSSLNGDK